MSTVQYEVNLVRFVSASELDSKMKSNLPYETTVNVYNAPVLVVHPQLPTNKSGVVKRPPK